MNYFIIKNNQQYGPYSLENLKEGNVEKNTLVWYDGLADWTKASELEELKHLFVAKANTPPPIPETEKKTPPPPPNNSNANNTTTRKKEVITFGKTPNYRLYLFIGIGIILIGSSIFLFTQSDSSNSHNNDYLDNQSKGNDSSENNYQEQNIKEVYTPPKAKTEAELRDELYQKEIANPLKYLTDESTYRVNLAANTIIEGSIYNNATMATFKNIKLKVVFYSDTDYKLGDDILVVLKNVEPNSSIIFKEKITGWWSNVDHFTCTIISAENY